MTDFTKPLITDVYTTLLPALVTELQDLARGLEPTLTGTHTNIPTGTIRWNATNAYWERYNGTTWVSLPSSGTNTYGINISGTAALSTSLSGATAWSIPYQSGAATTAYLSSSTAGFLLQTNGAAAPTWVNPTGITVGTATTVSTTVASGAVGTTQAPTDASTKIATTAFATPRTSTTGSAVLPAGIQSARDASPLAGYMRFNTTLAVFEGYNGTAWGSIGGGATGGAGDTVFQLNKTVVTTSFTLPTGNNAMVVGPLTINSGVTITIPTGQRMVIL